VVRNPAHDCGVAVGGQRDGSALSPTFDRTTTLLMSSNAATCRTVCPFENRDAACLSLGGAPLGTDSKFSEIDLGQFGFARLFYVVFCCRERGRSEWHHRIVTAALTAVALVRASAERQPTNGTPGAASRVISVRQDPTSAPSGAHINSDLVCG
jgi:hypothetical protein